MKVGYIRRKAFATNSSSTHTPVIVTGKLPEDYLIEDCEFGWQPFVVASEDAKRKYMGVALYETLRRLDIHPELSVAIVRDWVGVSIGEHSYIDHDSFPTIPLTFDGKLPHREFFDEFLKWMLNPQLVMLGGNDNDRNVNYGSYGTPIKKPIPEEMYDVRCRKDPKGFYTLLCENGTKIRMSFGESVNMSRSTAPELVDLKITDQCHSGCNFCYQGSTPGGAHASSNIINGISWALKKLEVFEVAIGGGEPTLHPKFWEFLSDFRSRGIVPNFSTRELGWLEVPKYVDIVRKNCGGFAYSVDEYDREAKIERYAKALISAKLEGQGTIQMIVVPDLYGWEMEKAITLAERWKIPVTLLGFKKVGRGATYRRHPAPEPIDWKKLLTGRTVPVSVDSALVNQYKDDLAAAKVAAWSMDIVEGRHSMYIDAVGMKMGPSSYCDASDYISCNEFDANKIKSGLFLFSEKAGR